MEGLNLTLIIGMYYELNSILKHLNNRTFSSKLNHLLVLITNSTFNQILYLMEEQA